MISFKSPNCFLRFLAYSSCGSWSSLSSPGLRFIGFSSLSQSRLFSGSTNRTFMEVFKEALTHASATHERTAIRAEQKSYSYVQLIASALDISDILHRKKITTVHESCRTEISPVEDLKRTGFLHQTRVGIVAKPSPEFVAGVLGTWLCGGVAVPLALSYPEAELLHVMNDSDVSIILSTQDRRELMENVAAKCSAQFSLLPSVTCMSPEVESHELSGNNEATPISDLKAKINGLGIAEGDDPALILYTSGTTGKPKGVVHTHKSIISQVQSLTEAWEYTTTDQFLHCLPLHHVHGLFNALLAPLYAGSVVEFMPKFSVRGIWQRWRESHPKDGSKADDGITLFTGVPTMYTRLLQGYETMDPDQRAASSFAANQLRLMMCGSSALPYPVMKQWEEITGHRLLERYGMTEFVMALSNPLHGNRKGGTVGKPLPRVEAKIIAEEESDIKAGVGELCVRSPSLFKEYWKKPMITRESFTGDGFFKTGDTVTVDEDGYYIILGHVVALGTILPCTGTNADIMKVGGYKLSALEIEAVLLEHEILSECCVLGLTDKDYGEVVSAIVVPQEEAKLRAEKEMKPAISLEELRNWSKERLAPYKIPTRLFLWDSLPRNAMGKVNKKELKKLLEGQS